MARVCNTGLLWLFFVLVAVLSCQCSGDEWRSWTAPGWASVSKVALGPDGAFRMSGGTSEMAGLLKATVREGLLSFRHLSPYNSLCVPGSIYDIHSDLNGLWLATDEGLVLYAGIYSVFYTPDNSPLPIKKVVELCAGPEGSIWVGTNESIHLMKDGLWVDFTTTSTILPDTVDTFLCAMEFDQERDILVYMTKGFTPGQVYESLYILHLETRQWTHISFDNIDFLNDKTVGDMVFDTDGKLWLAMYDGVNSFDGVEWTCYSSENSGIPGSLSVNELALSSEGELYAFNEGTSGGVCQFIDGQWVMLPVHAPHFNTYFKNMVLDSEDALWVFTNHGYIKLDSGDRTFYSLPSEGISDSIEYSRIVPSRVSDAVWVMGDGAGVCRFEDGAWQNWTPGNSGLASYLVHDIAEGPDGALWVLSGYPRSDFSEPEPLTLQRFDGTDWRNFSNGVSYFAPKITNRAPGRVLVDPSNNVWVGLNGFVLKFDGDYWREIQFPEGEVPSTVYSMAFDELTGNLAVGLFGSFCVLDETGWNLVTLDGNDAVDSLAYDHDGVLWGVIFNSKGVPHNAFSYDGTLLFIYNSELTGVEMKYTCCVAADADNVKWFGRYKSGLKKGGGAITFDGENWREVNSENFGFMQTSDGDNACICSIAFAPNGDAWFGSPYYGVSRLSNRGQPDPFPTIQVFLDKPEYEPGDTMTASLVESNLGNARWDVNVIIAMMPPDGSLFFFPNWTTSMNVFMPQVLLPGTLTQPMEFFQLPITELLPKGEYTWFAALANESGIIGQINSAPFTIGPRRRNMAFQGELGL